MCDLKFHQPGEHDSYHVLILRDGSGKFVNDKTQFGKVMLHEMPEIYSIGALDLWLFARFDMMREPDEFDFLNNESWFNTKLLISTQDKKEKWSK